MVLAKDYPADDDARAYIAAVEAADEADTPGIGALELDVVKAYDNFILGCKDDGIWDAIKVSCILAGAKTLEGSFIDLKSGTKILTNNNFADGTYVGSNYTTGDYNRKTGLKGNGSTKYLDSNRANNADSSASKHLSFYITEGAGGSDYLFGAAAFQVGGSFYQTTTLKRGALDTTVFFNSSTAEVNNSLLGMRRTATNNTEIYASGVTTSSSAAAQTPQNSASYYIYANNSVPTAVGVWAGRLAFYSIGSNLDLAKLDARVSTLISDLGAAIP
jgi:hypothetical protein